MEQWQWQEAKSKFVELVEMSNRNGPQMVLRRGEEAAVILSAKDYTRLSGNLPKLVELLLAAPRGSRVPEMENPNQTFL